MAERDQCVALTQKGEQCKNPAREGSRFCQIHQKSQGFQRQQGVQRQQGKQGAEKTLADLNRALEDAAHDGSLEQVKDYC